MDGQDYTAKLTLMNVHRIPAFTAARVSTQCFRMDVFVVPGMQALTAMLTLTSVHHPRAEMVERALTQPSCPQLRLTSTRVHALLDTQGIHAKLTQMNVHRHLVNMEAHASRALMPTRAPV